MADIDINKEIILPLQPEAEKISERAPESKSPFLILQKIEDASGKD